MQIDTLVIFSRQPGTRSEQQSDQSSSFELTVDLNFASLIQQPDYLSDSWNQICNNEIINPLVRETLDLFWL